jgi:maleate isomerase
MNVSTGTAESLGKVRFDAGARARATLGFVLLASEPTVEADMFRLTPPGVGVHFTRVPMAGNVSVEALEVIAAALPDAAALLLPKGGLDVVCYTCNSGTIVLGEERVMRELSRGNPTARATTVITNVIAALERFAAKRIVIATPYVDAVNRLEEAYFKRRGFEVLALEGLGIETDAEMARVSPDYLVEFVKSVDRPDAEAIFLSCGALRALDIVEPLERELGKPVIASNPAMMWDCLRLAGIAERRAGFGRLLAGA